MSEIRRLWYVLHKHAPVLQRIDLSVPFSGGRYILFTKGMETIVRNRGDFSAMEETLRNLMP
jgi:hypothetical protein